MKEPADAVLAPNPGIMIPNPQLSHQPAPGVGEMSEESYLRYEFPTWLRFPNLESSFQVGDILTLEPNGSLSRELNVFEKDVEVCS